MSKEVFIEVAAELRAEEKESARTCWNFWYWIDLDRVIDYQDFKEHVDYQLSNLVDVLYARAAALRAELVLEQYDRATEENKEK